MLRDEHCPPHVHVESEAAGWEARFAFSLVSDAVRLLDVDPIEEAPSAKTIDSIKAAIVANLVRCRAAWWDKIGTCCLDNRWVHIIGSEITVLAERERGASQIRTAKYGAKIANELTLFMKDGSTHTMKAGTGVER
jgi:hypothetical protein